MTRWFENIHVNEVFPLGAHHFTAEEIIRFGKLYDPQFFHLDADAAKDTHFGGLIASGWHTVCVGQRLMVDALFAEADRLRETGEEPGVAGPSPGINRMDFKAPVRPGDTVTYNLTVTSKRPSGSLPGWGILVNLVDGRNQHGQLVYEAELVSFSKMRDYRPTLMVRLLMAMAKWPLIGKLLRR